MEEKDVLILKLLLRYFDKWYVLISEKLKNKNNKMKT